MAPHIMIELEELQRDINRWNKMMDPGPNARFLKSRNKREGGYIGRRLRVTKKSLKTEGNYKFSSQHIRVAGNSLKRIALTKKQAILQNKLKREKGPSVDFSQLGIKLFHPSEALKNASA